MFSDQGYKRIRREVNISKFPLWIFTCMLFLKSLFLDFWAFSDIIPVGIHTWFIISALEAPHKGFHSQAVKLCVLGEHSANSNWEWYYQIQGALHQKNCLWVCTRYTKFDKSILRHSLRLKNAVTGERAGHFGHFTITK